MTTDLTIINQDELNAFDKETGGSQSDLTGGGNFIPVLKINYETEDDKGRELKAGTFYITEQEVSVYAKTVRFRPLLHNFQWTQYDAVTEKTVNRTKYISSFKEEARDEKGTLRCGKPPSKALKDNVELQKKYEDVTVYRNVSGVVSYIGTDVDGNEHIIENVVCTLRLKGSNFSPFQDEFIAKMPKHSNLREFELNLSTKREKQGSVVYYVIHYDVDFNRRLPLTVTLFDTAKGLKARFDDMNTEIDTKYFKALAAKSKSDAAIEALDKSASRRLDEDFIDNDIPF